jgi:Rha family phage regulatory protein
MERIAMPTDKQFDPNTPAIYRREDGTHVSDSRDIAAHFGKRPADILRAARKLLEYLPHLAGRSIALVDFIDKNGEARPYVEVDRKGFSLLVMGFTGRDAAVWKDKYTDAFEALAKRSMTPDQVRAMIREEMAEAVRLMKGAVWGMTKGQTTHQDTRFDRVDDDLNTIGVTALDTKEAIDRADLKSIGVILASRSIPTDRAFSNKCSISLRDFCSSRGLLTARSPETRAHVFPSVAVGPWMQAHGAVLVQARFEAVKAAAKVKAAAEKDARTGQTNLFPFPKPAG